jgi:hypothetical protein
VPDEEIAYWVVLVAVVVAVLSGTIEGDCVGWTTTMRVEVEVKPFWSVTT